MKHKASKMMKLFLSFAVLLTIVPSNISSIHAIDNEDLETVVTTIDNATTGTGINQFDFSSEWHNDANPVAFNKTEHWANKGVGDPGAWAKQPTVSLKFKGNKVELFGQKEITGATFRAVIDGNEDAGIEFSTYNAKKLPQELLYFKEGLAEGEHTLTLTILREFEATMGGSYEKNALSGVIDYAKVTSLEAVDANKDYETKVDNTDVTTTDELFKYNLEGSGWVQGAGSTEFYKGTEAYADNALNKNAYSIKFIGSGVKIIASEDPNHIDCDVLLDGKKIGDANGKGPKRKNNVILFEKSDIEYGEHILKVVPKSTSTGAIQADAVFITHKAIAPSSIRFDKEALSVETGLKSNVTASIFPVYATGNIVYTTGNPEIATISQSGEVSALKAGTTTITATVKGTEISASIPLTVVPEGLPLAISVGDSNFLATQDDYEKVLTQAKTTWTDVAWRGDVLNSKIDLAGKKATHNVKIIASDFTSGKNTIKANNIEINWLKETLANIGRGTPNAPVKPFPDIIHQDASNGLGIEKGKVQSAWINMNIPENAKPGTYTGTMSISADELEEPTVLKYSFEVLDIVQPNPQDMDTQVQIWQHPFSVANYYGVKEEDYFKEPHLKYMRESMKEYASLGGKDVVANIVNEAWGHQSYYGDPTMVQWIKKTDGSMTFDYDLFDRWIQFNIDSGVLDPVKGIGQIKCFSIVPWDDSFTYLDESTGKIVKEPAKAGDATWKSMWKSFLTDFMKHTEKKGWFDITYIALDERPMNRVGPAVDMIESVTNKDGQNFKISSAFNYESGTDYSFLDRIDDISIGLSHVDNDSNAMKDMSAHRKELGLLTTIYTCTGDYPGNYTISDPVDNAWCLWYTMAQNTNGYMKWAWDNWVADPLTNVSYKYWEPGDGWFIYPVEKDAKSDTYFYKTPRYELLKQGVRDVNKAKYLMEHSEEMSTEIDTFIKTIKRPAGGGSFGSAVPANPAERALSGSEVTRMRAGIHDFARTFISDNTKLVTSITVDKENVKLEIGETTSINATALPEDATYKELSWKSSDEKIATVSETGVITAIHAGTAIITVSAENGTVTKDIQVTVQAAHVPVTSITVDKETVELEAGQITTLKASVRPDNATNKKVSWTSSDETVVNVKDGVVTAIKAGTAIITVSAEDGKVTKDIKVNVTANIVVPEDKVVIDNTDKTISVVGDFPAGVTLETKKLAEDSFTELVNKVTAVNKEFFKYYKIEQIFDINMYLDEVVYQPDGTVVVKLTLSDDLVHKKLKVIRINEDGTIEEMESSINDGYILFTTDHFSHYAIVSETKGIDDVSKPVTPNTGDNTNVLAWGLLAISAACFYVIGSRRKKKHIS